MRIYWVVANIKFPSENPMAEIAHPGILDPEGFRLRFAKTEGFCERNSRILQLFNEDISFHTNFLHFFPDFEKINCTNSK